MKPKTAGEPESKAALSTEGLQKEVSAFASQLGLFAGGEGNGFNDADFRPEKATKSIGPQKGRSKKVSQPEDEQVMQLQQRLETGKEAGPSEQYCRYSREDPEKMAAVKGRTWKAGSGTRPGEKVGKTLVGKDEAPVWYEALEALPKLPGNGGASAAADELLLERLRNEGEQALENEAAVFEQDLSKKNRADSRWLQQVRQSGTTADKLAAMTLLLQESAVANLRSLDELMKWVGKRSGARGVAAQAIDALKELFTTILLPDRKLLFFEQQALASLPEGKEGIRRLLYYYMEDAVKKRYLQFAKDLQEASRDNLAFIKEKSIKAMYDLLCAKPEQEAFLLTCLVDKLGDPSRKIASNAGYLLGQLLEEHPAMNLVVAQEAERFLFKPHTPARAVYYGVVFLNQIVLSKRQDKGGSALAKKLISIYFTLFQLILEGKVGHAHELKATQEAQQAARGKGGAKKGGPKKKQRWKARPGGGKGAPGVANPGKPEAAPHPSQQPGTQAASVDAKLLGGLLAGIRRAFPFVDSSETEALMEQHSAALFRVTHTATFGVAVQALGLVFQLLDARSAVSDRFYRALYGMLLHPDLARSNKTGMFLSLLYKAMKADISNHRILAFIKRLLQVAAGQMPNFTCGCLLLVSEVLKERSALWGAILEVEEAGDDVERFDDADRPATLASSEPKPAAKDLDRFGDGSDEERDVEMPGGKSVAAGRQEDENQGYDMRKRDPKYARAERSCVWELVLLAEHVHPSVAAMTRALLAGVAIEYAGDPMRDMSTSAFLDKFVQKKPKVHIKGASLMQPVTKPSLTELVTPAFAALSAADAAPDTAYFHKFFEVKAQREAAGVRPKSKRRAKREAEVGPLASDEDSLAGSDAESDEIDDFMEHMEDSEDEAAPRGYDDLAAAMAADGAEASTSDEEADDSGGEEHGESAGEGVESENGASGRSSGSGGSVESDAMFGDSSDEEDSDAGVPEDINVFELPGPSDEESFSGDDEGDDDDSDDEAEWVMASPGDLPGPQKTKPKPKGAATPRGRVPQPKSKRKGDSANVFAAAEEYADSLNEDQEKPAPQTGRIRMKRRKLGK